MSAISSDEIISILKEEIKNYDVISRDQEVGTVISVGDGIASVYGIDHAMYGEIVTLETGLKGMVQDIKENEISCILFGDDSEIKQGTKVCRTGKKAGIPVGEGYIGRIVDALGAPIDGKGEIKADGYRPVENEAPGIVERKSVSVPLETGILSIDSMFPIGRGQRELIIGDRQTGKTSIATDTIINQKGKDVICIYVAIGQKASTVARLVNDLKAQEMKPRKKTPAHHADLFGELVCSNSLRSDQLENAVGLLKEELRRLGSLILRCADEHRVAAGGALAVDRTAFAQAVTDAVRSHPLITVEEGEVTALPETGQVIVATGPLTADALAGDIARRFPGSTALHFYDAAAPLVTFESIDMDSAWFASRYDKGTADYINCPLTQEEYLTFWRELCAAKEAPVHGFEDRNVFEGCMPVEVMARRGEQTLCYGPLKPRGLRDPKTGREPYAVVQLRRDNAGGSIYNLVGFQTHLTWPEQKRVFSLIPALRQAEFVRYGVMHRNTYLDSPRLLDRYYRVRTEPRIVFAGQITGVEGYVESTASGFVAALELARRLEGKAPIDFPPETALGALALYVSNETVEHFQPMNINFGIMPPLGYRVKGKRNKNAALSQRSLEILAGLEELGTRKKAYL